MKEKKIILSKEQLEEFNKTGKTILTKEQLEEFNKKFNKVK